MICFVTVWPITVLAGRGGAGRAGRGWSSNSFHKNVMRSFAAEFDKAESLPACHGGVMAATTTTTTALHCGQSPGPQQTLK